MTNPINQSYFLPFGAGQLSVELNHRRVCLLAPAKLPPLQSPYSAIMATLNNPHGSKPLSQLLSDHSRIAIIVNDHTRPTPTRLLLSPILDLLSQVGIPDHSISIVFALGAHEPLAPDQMASIVGLTAYSRFTCENSGARGFVQMGQTLRGTPVEIDRSVVEADFVIATGEVELHFFAGYSGGAKAIVPGVSSFRAITANHSLLKNPNATSGEIDENPVRLDLEEAADLVPHLFCLNIVLDEHQQIVACVSGDHRLAHRVAVSIVDQMYKRPLTEAAAVVIASGGGWPRDINLYQAQKALEHACKAVKPGGTIILLAACSNGLGNPAMERWFQEVRSPEECIHRLTCNFELGGYSAAGFARLSRHAHIFLYSELAPNQAKLAFMQSIRNLQETIEKALSAHPNELVVVMPFASATLPILLR